MEPPSGSDRPLNRFLFKWSLMGLEKEHLSVQSKSKSAKFMELNPKEAVVE